MERKNSVLIRFTLPLIICALLIPTVGLFADECKDFIELHSAKYVANEYGESESWVLNNVKINLWEKQTSQGRGRKVGKLLPGSRALIIEIGPEDYKVKSPYDKSIGWVNEIQVSRVIKLDTKTYEPCK